MASIEQAVKSQFANVFMPSDWRLFKAVAESNLKEAAELKKVHMPIKGSLKLLARNSRKRLLIGVGVELLLKAVYLKYDYMINKPPPDYTLKFPFSVQAAASVQLVADKTFTLDKLISNLAKVVQLQDKGITLRGLKIAQVFRNKEGHVITRTHTFDASNYTDIAASLYALYRDAFGETLSVQFSLAPKESAVWRVSSNQKR